MAKRKDIKSILVVGAGPIIIGQACEFDYSGTQACKALMEEGYRVILINSNPATIMTDPETADVVYIEPITPDVVKKIIIKEKPDVMLPTMGGQTALNIALSLSENGTLKKYDVELIGANLKAIKKAEERESFYKAMKKIGLDCPKAEIARSIKESYRSLKKLGLPVIIRPSLTLGGTGGGIANTEKEFDEKIGTYKAGPDENCPDVKNPIAGFAAMIEHLDNQVGELLDVLREEDIEENTLVLFCSDNGAHREGGHSPEFWNSTGPLKGIKRDLYEGGIRSPLLARWVGTIAAGGAVCSTAGSELKRVSGGKKSSSDQVYWQS